jgi:hypothetical protein
LLRKKHILIHILQLCLVINAACYSLPKKDNAKSALSIDHLLDGRYDTNNFLVNNPLLGRVERMDFKEIEKSTYEILTTTILSDPANDAIFENSIECRGLAIDEHHLLTVGHSTATLEKHFNGLDVRMKNSYIVLDSGRDYYQNIGSLPPRLVKKLEEVLRDDQLDMVLYRVPKKILPENVKLKPFPYKYGNSSELNIGHRVYIVGNSSLMGLNVRDGIVSMTDVPVLDGYEGNDGDIITSIPMYPGDSGMPVIALRDGEYEFVGLAKAILPAPATSVVLGIDAIRNKIDQAGLTDLANRMCNNHNIFESGQSLHSLHEKSHRRMEAKD